MTASTSLLQICHDTGLSCEACSTASARNLARVCPGMRGKMIGQLFVQLYPDPVCAPMHAHFATAYRNAEDEPEEEPEPLAAPEPLTRRGIPVQGVRRVMVAVA